MNWPKMIDLNDHPHCKGSDEGTKISFLYTKSDIMQSSTYIDDFGGFTLLTGVHVQVVTDPIIHSVVELHLRSLLNN